MTIENTYLTFSLIICYGLTIWLARQTIKELNIQEHELTERTKKLQRQFSKALFVQVS